ncbi:MAG: S41 family peptidase, partial [Verrucomicrobiae bacterium]|nr:S41 family peptidase [Verrucomicrobiae bacterium]
MNRTTLTGLLPALCLLLTAILSAPSLPAQEKKPDAPAPKAAPEKPAPPAGEKPKEAAKPAPARQASDDDEAYKQIELFTRVLEIVRQNYVDPEKTSYEKLINSALAGMLGDLDPHSQFMQPKVYEQLQQNTGSTYEGVGITISTRNDILSIVSVREDGPAARAGVLPGDQILKINDLLTEDIGLTEAITLLKGKPGEKVKMTLRRPSTKELIEVEMTREIIKQSTLKDITLLDPNLTNPYKIGYARLLQFSDPSADELADALDDLEQKGMQAFILDLRNNPGGLLNVAIDIIGEFVPAGSLVLTTEGKPGSGEVRPYRTTADRKRRDREYPVAILMNYASASGSEVVAGALQDMQRAIIVGETSFGKGSVQSIMPLDGSEGKAI